MGLFIGAVVAQCEALGLSGAPLREYQEVSSQKISLEASTMNVILKSAHQSTVIGVNIKQNKFLEHGVYSPHVCIGVWINYIVVYEVNGFALTCKV